MSIALANILCYLIMTRRTHTFYQCQCKYICLIYTIARSVSHETMTIHLVLKDTKSQIVLYRHSSLSHVRQSCGALTLFSFCMLLRDTGGLMLYQAQGWVRDDWPAGEPHHDACSRFIRPFVWSISPVTYIYQSSSIFLYLSKVWGVYNCLVHQVRGERKEAGEWLREGKVISLFPSQ